VTVEVSTILNDCEVNEHLLVNYVTIDLLIHLGVNMFLYILISEN